MRVFITGISGFAGSFLAEHLLANGYEVWGLVHRGPGHVAHIQTQLTLRQGDITDFESVHAVLAECRPARIYHLAAQSFVPRSWENPWETLENNIRGQLNVLEAARRLDSAPRILVVGSNEAYGRVQPNELPISETTPFRPISPYGVSKATQDLMGYQYWATYGMHVVRVRPFNHIGPRQSAQFVAAAFASQLAEIEAGVRPPVLYVGNLDAKRDFSDVRDVVRAYHLALEEGAPGEVYNIGSGEARSVQSLLDTLLAFTSVEVRVERDPARMRPSDIPEVRADIRKIQATTGWTPEIPFEQSVRDVLDYWRQRVWARLHSS
ncbi:MAG: SDR family oxidoreductase [Ardenticatenia bacterium]|nr:MAG: SDR family oxidoreductase [Ardenticatenia bacterium]